MVKKEEISYQIEAYIKATKAQVWNPLTVPEEVSKYFMCPMVRCGSKVGELIEFGMDNQQSENIFGNR
jgi:uncharacterized protein YndB with AHSA1/START domain